MTRSKAMAKILHFGREEENALRAEGKPHDAYQIQHARETLIYCLNENPIKNIIPLLNRMTEYRIDENGFWRYDVEAFVADELTRELLVKFKKEFEPSHK